MTGQYAHNIDAKGRLFIPAKLREELGETFHVTIGPDHCLTIYPNDTWDCLTDVFLQPVQRHIVVKGFDSMPRELREYAAPMREIFGDLQEKYPWVSVTYR